VEEFSTEDGHVLADRLAKLGLPAGPVLHVDEALAAPHTAARQMVTELDGYRALGTPIKLSRTPGGLRTIPPKFGEHGAAVLSELGYSETEIAGLIDDGVLHTKRKR
jgi:crotonobetainyl-CoA:carnitine CoA-transferase CaiB-like acyl-CoA transferase